MDITILSDVEIRILWGIAFVMPFAAHWAVRRLSRAVGVEAGSALPRVLLLTTVSLLTLLYLTGSRFSAIEVGREEVRLRYAFPGGRTTVLDRDEVAGVSLNEERFPRHSYTLLIVSGEGERYRSVGVTPAGLEPLYEAFSFFHPDREPFVALPASQRATPF